jgi:hypothetical protein
MRVDSQDYDHKYPKDELFRELDDDARIWKIYNDEAEIFDREMVESAGDTLDILLIFVRKTTVFRAGVTTEITRQLYSRR